MRYVLGEHGILADLGVEGALARHLRRSWRDRPTHAMRQRWDSVRRRFDWKILAPEYQRMFQHAAYDALPAGRSCIARCELGHSVHGGARTAGS